MLNVVMLANMLCVHACQVLLERHQRVDLNALVHLNVHQRLLVSIKSVLIHAPARAVLGLAVRLSTIHRYVVAIQVKRVIHLEAVNQFQFHHQLRKMIHVS